MGDVYVSATANATVYGGSSISAEMISEQTEAINKGFSDMTAAQNRTTAAVGVNNMLTAVNTVYTYQQFKETVKTNKLIENGNVMLSSIIDQERANNRALKQLGYDIDERLATLEHQGQAMITLAERTLQVNQQMRGTLQEISQQLQAMHNTSIQKNLSDYRSEPKGRAWMAWCETAKNTAQNCTYLTWLMIEARQQDLETLSQEMIQRKRIPASPVATANTVYVPEPNMLPMPPAPQYMQVPDEPVPPAQRKRSKKGIIAAAAVTAINPIAGVMTAGFLTGKKNGNVQREYEAELQQRQQIIEENNNRKANYERQYQAVQAENRRRMEQWEAAKAQAQGQLEAQYADRAHLLQQQREACIQQANNRIPDARIWAAAVDPMRLAEDLRELIVGPIEGTLYPLEEDLIPNSMPQLNIMEQIPSYCKNMRLVMAYALSTY